MTENRDEQQDELTQEELDAQEGEQLPEREAMSVLDPPLTPDPTLITDPWPAE